MILIDGKERAKEIRRHIKVEIAELKNKNIVPGLAVVLVGENPASVAYVNSNEKLCKRMGVYSDIRRLSENITQEALLDEIEQLNRDTQVHGILIQLPLPGHIDEKAIIEALSPEKDVDGFHPLSAGKLLIGEDCFRPCTPYGVMRLLEAYNIDLDGKNAVVIGRSNIVGKPIALMLMEKNATVTISHSRTKNLSDLTKKADIIIVAIGKAFFLTKEMVSKDTIVIDVGINSLDGKIVGDVDFESVKDVASYLTPVPGGVGSMTTTMLLENTLKAAKMENDII